MKSRICHIRLMTSRTIGRMKRAICRFCSAALVKNYPFRIRIEQKTPGGKRGHPPGCSLRSFFAAGSVNPRPESPFRSHMHNREGGRGCNYVDPASGRPCRQRKQAENPGRLALTMRGAGAIGRACFAARWPGIAPELLASGQSFLSLNIAGCLYGPGGSWTAGVFFLLGISQWRRWAGKVTRQR